MTILVSIVEDDSEVRESLAGLVNSAAGFQCVSSHADAESALKVIPGEVSDVVLMDINLPGISGVECVRKLKARRPAVQVLMLTVYENTDRIFDALTAGASGYLLKQTPLPDLLAAIRDVHQGGSPMSSHIARKVVQSFQRPPEAGRDHQGLSPRESQVLDRLAQGYLYKEIADQLNISFETVHTYIRRIYEKLHVRSRTEAVAKYLKS